LSVNRYRKGKKWLRFNEDPLLHWVKRKVRNYSWNPPVWLQAALTFPPPAPPMKGYPPPPRKTSESTLLNRIMKRYPDLKVYTLMEDIDMAQMNVNNALLKLADLCNTEISKGKSDDEAFEICDRYYWELRQQRNIAQVVQQHQAAEMGVPVSDLTDVWFDLSCDAFFQRQMFSEVKLKAVSQQVSDLIEESIYESTCTNKKRLVNLEQEVPELSSDEAALFKIGHPELRSFFKLDDVDEPLALESADKNADEMEDEDEYNDEEEEEGREKKMEKEEKEEKEEEEGEYGGDEIKKKIRKQIKNQMFGAMPYKDNPDRFTSE